MTTGRNTITQFDVHTAKQLRQLLERKLSEIEDEMGITMQVKTPRLSSRRTLTLEVVASVGDEVTLEDTPDGRFFKAYAAHYGLQPNWLGATFNSRGTLYKITGLKTNRPKYPVETERVYDGAAFKFPAHIVKSAMGA